jgi:hypothetical protein
MTKKSWPYVSQATTDLEYSKLFRNLQRSGVVGVPGDTTLKGTAPGSTLTVQCAAGSAIVRGYYFESTAVEDLTHASGSSNQRIDRGVLRLDFSQALSTRVAFAVLAGTPASSNPTIPALTQVTDAIWEIPLYRVLVPASATSLLNSNVVDERQFIGQQPGKWTTSTRPSPPVKFDMGYNDTLGYWEYYTGLAAPNDWKKIVNGVDWLDIANRPAIPTQSFFTSDISPLNSQGVNGDWWAEY